MSASTIQIIDQASVHRLTSGQVVIDLQTAVKELLENALDAGATSVELVFRDHGVESFEVRDNGKGIDESDWPGIALKHHTSKLTNFSDLTSVSTLGFRGEALSSLCGTAKLSLVTANAASAPRGTTLTFARDGECQIGAKVARAKGTTVIVRDLFKSLPVRRKELEKNAAREFKKALVLVQSYALIRTGCRFSLSNTIGTGKVKMELLTPASSTVRSNFSAIFVGKSAPLIDLDLVLDVEADKSVLKWTDGGVAESTRVLVKGLISKPVTGSGRGTGDRQFFFINGRPFSPSKIAKGINEVYRSFNTGAFPILVADFLLPTDAYDVNVSPDKRTIFLHSEINLLAALKIALEALFQPYRSTFTMTQIGAKPPAAKPKVASTSSNPPHVDTPMDRSSPRPEEMEDEVIVNPVISKRQRSGSSRSGDEPATGEAGEKGLVVDVEAESVERPNKKQRSSQSSSNRLSPPPLLPNPFDPLPPTQTDDDPLQGDLSSPPAQVLPNDNSSPPLSSPPQIVAPIPQKLRQMTLDTTGASWAVPVVIEARKKIEVEKVERIQKAQSHLRKFLNPPDGQPVENGVPKNDEEAEVEVLEDEEEDDEIMIVDPPPRSSSPIASENEGDFSADLQQERTAHLESLDTSFANPSGSQPRAFRDEMVGTQSVGEVTLAFDMDSLVEEWTSNRREYSPEASTSSERLVDATSLGGAAIDQKVSDEAEATLSRIVGKEDFEKMEIIGQFNLGFIIARRRVGMDVKGKGKAIDGLGEEQDDLFIVDQHASDEIYNFESLQQTTIIQSQRLISFVQIFFLLHSMWRCLYPRLSLLIYYSPHPRRPRELNLPSQDEMTAIEHRELLRMNGFEIQVDEEADVGRRVHLIAQPVSKGTTFGVEDLEELLDLVKNIAPGQMIRPSKTRRMFASRACRMSVMIGTALTTNQMTTVLRHMGTMDQPWACPHGRPTMRWLAGLNGTKTNDRRSDLVHLFSNLVNEDGTTQSTRVNSSAMQQQSDGDGHEEAEA